MTTEKNNLLAGVRVQAKAYFTQQATEKQRALQAFGMTDLPLIEGYMDYFQNLFGERLIAKKQLRCTPARAFKLYVTKEEQQEFQKAATLGFMDAVEMVA